jgi:hypothetical protein
MLTYFVGDDVDGSLQVGVIDMKLLLEHTG